MIAIRQRLLWAALFAGFSMAASAQSSGAPDQPSAQASMSTDRAKDFAQKHERMHARMEKRFQEHMDALKAKLNLSANQQGDWNTFAQACKPPAPPAERPEPSAFMEMTTPQRLDVMQKRMAERNDAFTRYADAVRTFYGKLTPEQQKTFDAMPMRMMRHQGGPGMLRHRWENDDGYRNDDGTRQKQQPQQQQQPKED
ncbi:MAG: Spy/CpxP family protein refolding chaperone [Burkholderiaceae bacterium]|jgi:hypothetical protein|nr:Spy/CpxP family protein refolding chaperone [Burkholderiaceae bacterium]